MPRAAPKKMKKATKRSTKCGCKGGFNKMSLRKCNQRKAFKKLLLSSGGVNPFEMRRGRQIRRLLAP